MFDSNKLLGNTLHSALCYAPHVMHAKGYRRIEEQAATSMLGSARTGRANAERKLCLCRDPGAARRTGYKGRRWRDGWAYCCSTPFDMSSAMIATSSSALAYATLAELSTEMQTFDAILDNTGAYHTSPPFHPQLPVEIMLLIREELQSSLVYRAADDAVRALDTYEAAVRRSLCGDCLAYNQDVFGDDIWRWRWSGPCACRADRRRRHTHRETRPFRTLGDWLEHHLSSRTPASSIREAMSLVLGRHGCQSSALLPSAASSVGTLPETFVITASPSAVARCQGRIGEDTEWCSEIVLRRARRDLGLAVAASLDFALQRKIDAPGDSTTKEPVRQHSTILPSYALSAVAGGCAAVLTLPIVSIAFVVLVTCHYVRPSGVRVF